MPPTKKQRAQAVPGKEQVSIYLPHDVAESLRITAVKERRRMSDLAEELIATGLRERDRRTTGTVRTDKTRGSDS